MCVLLTLFVVIAYVEDASSEDFCKLDIDSRVQYCFDPGSINGLRRCNTYEPADVIHRPGCNAPSQYSNRSLLAPKRCVDGKWVDVTTCTPGPQCVWKGVGGRCVNKYRCLSAAENIFKEKPPICGYEDNEPMICCTDCSLVKDTRQILFNKRIGFLYKNGRKAHDECIDFINELDYPCSTEGGKRVEWVLDDKKKCYNAVEQDTGEDTTTPDVSSADRNEFPHVALLGFGTDVLSLTWLCGGSLISHNFILTAANCADSPIAGPATYVALGIERLSDPPEKWQRYKVKNVITHPNYESPSLYNDIALLETETPVLFNGVRPACLHVGGVLDVKATAIASGSVLNVDNLGDTLLPIQQDKYSDEECLSSYPPNLPIKNGYNSSTQLCYGDRTKIENTCAGDSGGPLQSREHYPGRCVFTILGIISTGRGRCRFPVIPETLFTRVQYYVPWIESVVWP